MDLQMPAGVLWLRIQGSYTYMKVMRAKNLKQKADLYQFVFGSTLLKYVVAIMMLFFLMHPVMPAFASELEASPEPSEVSAEPAELVTTEPVSEGVAESDINDDQLVDSEVLLTEVSNEVLPDETVSLDAPTPDESDVSVPVSTSDDVEDVVPETPSATEEVITESIPTPEDSVGEVVSFNDGAVSNEETEVLTDEEETASSTVPEPEFFEVPNTADHTDNLYQFTKQQCVSMGEGAYHCFEAKTESLIDERGSLYVAQDADGDKEIYLVTNDREYAITDNKLDDDAPHYDPVSDSIVWHRLVDGRYQIFDYQDKHETLLSADFENSMEPHRAGAYTVWQSWVDGGWQVVLNDSTSTRVISTSGGQNIAPQVEGDYVIWNVTDGVTHKVAVYEIATGLVSLIDDEEGARVYNPRFVLVYDTKFDNGDVITKGYDAETGDVVPLAAAAPAMPEELPESDQTGETRALLQNKSPSRDDSTEELDTSESANTTPLATTSAETLEENGEVLIPDISIATTTPNLPLTDFDIIVEPFLSSASTQQ
jgi:hypothetical protein